MPGCVPGTMLLPDACGDQKRASDPLALELETVVSHRVVAANEHSPLQEQLELLPFEPSPAPMMTFLH